MIMVLYEKGSLYEKFLFSGRGASHYDAAIERSDGTFQLVWITEVMNASPNITQPVSLVRGVSAGRSDRASTSGQLVSSRLRRPIKQDPKQP